MLRRAMEPAPLRPVPGRPNAPVPDRAAVSLVAAALPARERTALALVALAGTARAAVAMRLGIGEEELAESLARARKELRRTVAALPGSGWCERAERQISDRIDGALSERDEPRLDVHLRNCPRCVEHERRLVQATDALVAGVVTPAPSAPEPEPPALAAIEPEPATQLASRQPSPAELGLAVGWVILIVVAIVLALAALAVALSAQL
jgi:hypothetical protein